MSQHDKIAYLISQYPAVSHTFILNEIKYLRLLGFDIQVASINEPDTSLKDQTDEEKEETKRTYYIKKNGAKTALISLIKTFVGSPISFFYGLFYASWLGGLDIKRIFIHLCYFAEAAIVNSWMKSIAIDHLHVHFGNPASSVAMIAAKMRPIKYSMTIHGPDIFDNIILNNLKAKIEGARFICCIGHYARSQLMRFSDTKHWDKFEVTPLGVNTTKFKPYRSPQSHPTIRLLSIGRFVKAKGFHTLIDAINILIQKGLEIHLNLIGDGPERNNLEKTVENLGLNTNISFWGSVNHDNILVHYQNSDLFVLPSYAEGIPIVLMEAMAFELPCIATYVNGIPELIRHNENGFLVIPSDSDELAKVIEYLINNPYIRREFGTAARKRIQNKYELDKNINHLGKIFSKRLGKGA